MSKPATKPGASAAETAPLIGELLTCPPPPITDAEALQLAKDAFGLSGSLKRLTSERDANFLVHDAAGSACVLKVTNAAEDPAVTNLQTETLLHLQRTAPQLPVPRVHQAIDGSFELRRSFDGKTESTIRVLTYLAGEPLHRVDTTAHQRRNVAAELARLDIALKDFHHPAADHDLLWDTKNAARLRPFAADIADPALRSLVERQLDVFDRHVAPVLADLRAQPIHNDLNPHNVLVHPNDHTRVTGIFDFGDMVHTPLVIDIAVAASYQIGSQDDPLTPVAEFVAAYHEVLPLAADEVALLFDLIAARLLTTVVITNWRSLRHPENREYILRNHGRAAAGLQAFAPISRADAERIFRTACKLEPHR
ncbi:phosphotransferase [Pseudohoeflea coraliihabitans]|uniref:Phosphotransferase n=1 Tax=Pseudohoeflea coraliihabitans TaxID=2860393 RepID=A0ABS6WQV2_9HYPH|nr:phosphotransferase [Pseudohoeflea sp. DP4N28-3]